MTASPENKTTQLLDAFIAKQRQHKRDAAVLDEMRKDIQAAYENGELEAYRSLDKVVYNELEIICFERKNWKYSSAIDALKEQEQFNGTATQTTNNTFRFTVRSGDS